MGLRPLPLLARDQVFLEPVVVSFRLVPLVAAQLVQLDEQVFF